MTTEQKAINAGKEAMQAGLPVKEIRIVGREIRIILAEESGDDYELRSMKR